MSTTRAPFLLCVLDGVGLNPNPVGNAVAAAKKATLDRLFVTRPWTTLATHGERVGLPEGQMGNSEVGHLNIGAGRVVEQWLLRISRALQRGDLAAHPAYRKLIDSLSPSNTLHVAGLYSPGGVHSHSEHLHLLLDQLLKDFQGKIALHLFTDGRDTPPQSAAGYVEELVSRIALFPQIQIASIIGRFFAMDRDKRWDRTERAYKALVSAEGRAADDPVAAIRESYEHGVNDEFIEPIILKNHPVRQGDGLLVFNFREDRARQLVNALTQSDFAEFKRSEVPFPRDRILSFTEYDPKFRVPYVFAPLEIAKHLGATVAERGMTQLRVAETEKYPHVTYFLNGGHEEPSEGEKRILIPSPRDVKTYDMKPEMSAYPVAAEVEKAARSGEFDLIVVNIANGDMVGHTGDFQAAVTAVETADICLGTMLKAIEDAGGQALIIADHGNAEQMIDYETLAPHTAHTTYPVPCVLVAQDSTLALRDGGALCDVAPTILELMGTPPPAEMTGTSLLLRGR